MIKKSSIRKIALRSEILRNLTAAEMNQIAGGARHSNGTNTCHQSDQSDCASCDTILSVAGGCR